MQLNCISVRLGSTETCPEVGVQQRKYSGIIRVWGMELSLSDLLIHLLGTTVSVSGVRMRFIMYQSELDKWKLVSRDSI